MGLPASHRKHFAERRGKTRMQCDGSASTETSRPPPCHATAPLRKPAPLAIAHLLASRFGAIAPASKVQIEVVGCRWQHDISEVGELRKEGTTTIREPQHDPNQVGCVDSTMIASTARILPTKVRTRRNLKERTRLVPMRKHAHKQGEPPGTVVRRQH